MIVVHCAPNFCVVSVLFGLEVYSSDAWSATLELSTHWVLSPQPQPSAHKAVSWFVVFVAIGGN